jgi:hypothetical protein
MRTLTTKPRCVLLDANIVIESHRLGVWDHLKNRCQLSLPAIVSKHEALFCIIDGHKVEIHLLEQIRNGEIVELEATADEVSKLYEVFEPWFLESLDPGETEALALMQAGRLSNTLFCTSDSPAIMALAMIHMSHLGLSFETLLGQVGLTKSLQKQFSESFFKSCTKKGNLNLVTGWGLKNGLT